ncbi:MAG: hypothetical protein ACRENQ_04935 [Gemmatimonadaceae bacterium]
MSSALQALFAFLFKYRPSVFHQGDLAFGAPVSVIVLAAMGLVVVAVAGLTYGRVRGRSSRRDRWVLAMLRVAALAVLVACLFRPMLLLSEAVPQRNFVGVLIDDSRSMQIADRGGKERADFVRTQVAAPHAPLLDALRSRFQVRLFRFGATTQRLDSARGLAYDERETRLGDGIESARRELESVPLSGLVVLTDGADNANTPLADELLRLRAQQVPVFTVGLGAPQFDHDIEITRVETPHAVLQHSTLMAAVLVRQRGYAGKTVPLIIEDAGQIIARTEVTLPADGDVAPITVHALMDHAGPRTLTFRIPAQPGEQVAQNNTGTALVEVQAARQKILYVEGEPRYEVRFIRAAVEADSSLQLVVLQRTAANKFLRLNVDGPTELAGGFPTTRAELFRYKAVILGSIEASFFSRDQMQMLADFVNVRGGGLLFLGGRRAFAEGGYSGTPLADVMPVVIAGPAVPDSVGFLADLQVKLTPTGMTDAITQLGGADSLSAKRWSTLPIVTSVNHIRGVKPGAVTLVEGVVPAGGRAGSAGEKLSGYTQPVLTFQHYGRGVAYALPVQDTWQWQMDPSMPVGDPTFSTFWRQLLRQLTTGIPGRVTVTVAADQVNPGTPVQLQAEVVDSAYLAANDAQVVAHVTEPSGATRTVPFEWTVNQDGVYRATFTPDEQGLLRIQVEATRGGANPAFDSTFVRVADLNTEFVNAEMRADLLQRVATETGGKFYTPANVSTLPQDLAMTRRGVTVVNQMDLWDMPINFLLLIGLVSAEWVYRRARGLA